MELISWNPNNYQFAWEVVAEYRGSLRSLNQEPGLNHLYAIERTHDHRSSRPGWPASGALD